MASRGYTPQSPQGAKSVNGQHFHMIAFTFAHRTIILACWITRFVVPFEGFLRFDFSSPWLRRGKDGRGTTGLLIPTVFFVTRSDSDSTNKQRINPPYIWNIRAKKQYLYVRKWLDSKYQESRNGTKWKDILGVYKNHSLLDQNNLKMGGKRITDQNGCDR